MKVVFKMYVILFTPELFNKIFCFRCPKFQWENCQCLDETFLCPGIQRKEIELTVTRNYGLNLQCFNESAEYIDLVPSLNMSQSQTLTIDYCKSYVRFYELVRKLHTTNIKSLQIQLPSGLSETGRVSKEFFGSLQIIEELIFANGKIRFSKDFLKATPNLLYLKLNNNGLTEINFNFSYVPELKWLYLSMNQISTLPSGIFKSLSNLVHLHLDSNELTSLPKDVFAGLRSLRYLNLENNNIEELPADIFEELYNLTDLGLNRNKITKIYDNIFEKNTFLTNVWLQQNKLLDIPENTFRNCKLLEKIILNRNQLTGLHEDVFRDLKQLHSLDISGNSLSVLTENMFLSLGHLETLSLSYNKLKVINMSWFQNVDDMTLILNNNEIEEYPKISGMKIKELDLSFNQITHIEIQDFITHSNVNVNLKNNKIKQVDFRFSQPLSELLSLPQSTVHLENNPISCDCSNYNLVSYNNDGLKEIKKLVKIVQKDLKCLGSINNKSFADLKPSDIDCPILYDCPYPCNCYYKPFNGEQTVNCSLKNMTSFSIVEDLNLIRYTERELIEEKFANVTFTNLDLSGNMLSKIDWVPPHVKVLDLSGNNFTNLDKDFIDTLNSSSTLKRLHLKDNPWKCNCESLELQKYLLEYFGVVNSSEVYCKEFHTDLVNIKNLCKVSAYISVLLPAVLTVFLCFAITCALYYRYQTEIKVFLFAHKGLSWLVTEEELDKDKTYDVFVSYAHQDEKFVVEQLLSELEHGERPFKVCIHMRDWMPGVFISEQIVNTVKNSRRTLVVLSNNFVDSVWGKIEFRTAHTEAMSEGRARVIVLIYGDLDESKLDDDLKSYIKTNTYVKWGEKYFWNKLRYALPHSNPGHYERNKSHAKIMLKLSDSVDLIKDLQSPCNTSTPPLTSDPPIFNWKVKRSSDVKISITT